MRQQWYLLLGLILLLGSCQIRESLEIVNPPPYLPCGARYQFLVEFFRQPPCPPSWDARYGSIDAQGLYFAPDFPCQEIVGVTVGSRRKEVTFPVVRDSSEINVGVSEEVSLPPVFRVLTDVPSSVASRQVSFDFLVRGKFSVMLNGVVLQEGYSGREDTISLLVTLEEGENLLRVFLEGREVFRRRIFCDTTPPVFSLSRAVATPEGVRLFGSASEEIVLEVARGRGPCREWEILVPWQGERRVLLRDLVGNTTEEVFSVERDLEFVVVPPSRIKVGHEAFFLVRCKYRDVPLEGEVFCRGEVVTLEAGEGMFVTTFTQGGSALLVFRLGSVERSVVVEVYNPSVDSLLVTTGLPEEVVAGVPFVVEGVLQDAFGDPCPGKVVRGEIRAGSSVMSLDTVSDARGKWCLVFEGLSRFGERVLYLQSEGKTWQKTFYLISGEPASFLRVQPGPVLRYVAGSREVTFAVQVTTSQGSPVQGTKVEWVWKKGNEISPVPPEDLKVQERTDMSGKCSGIIVLPRKVGTYALEARLAFWNVPPVSWEVTVLPANPGYFDDLSRLPPSGRVGEPLSFVVRVRDIFGNPCPGKTVNVYRREGNNLTKIQSVTTDEEGQAAFSLTPESKGTLVVEAWVYQANLSLTWSIPVEAP